MKPGIRRSALGFSLVEALVAIGIGSATVILAAQIGAAVIRSNTLGEQKNDLEARARTLMDQIRDDISLAGLGSTGAIGVDVTDPTLGLLALAPTAVGGRRAIPAIAGANTLNAAPLPGGVLLRGSDALQLVVPNPRTRVRTTDRAVDGTSVLPVDGPLEPGCALVYVHDHTNPTGAGRTQIDWLASASATQITLVNRMVFTAAPGSSVMCARISTYWVDETFYLHRTDLQRAGAFNLAPWPVWVSTAPQRDAMVPGVQGFQIAHAVSAEAYRQGPLAGPAPLDPLARWAFTGATPSATALFAPANPHVWFEVRMVRVNAFVRRLKRVNGEERLVDAEPREDGDTIPHAFGSGGEWMTVAESLVNLRIFDSATAAELRAEPF